MELDQAIQLAISQAHQGAPFVSPNPKVGCVILDSKGELLSKGYHKKFGQPHAEVEALNQIQDKEKLKGAHVIVTLEPCAHEGKTPSCAKTLAKLPIKKVTYGLVDPNPLVAGKGAEILKAAGIEAEEYQGPFKKELEETCEEFLWNFRQKKVFVALKVAQSSDGKISKVGERIQITGPEAMQKVHELRAQYDAVLVGKNTILIDNPKLDVRHSKIIKENKVIVLDRSGEVLKSREQLNIFKTHNAENVHVLSSQNLETALKEIYNLGIRSVMVEGGGEIFTSFLNENLAQRIHLFTAPVVLGEGVGWSDKKIELKSKPQLYGKDIYITELLSALS